MQIGFDNDKYLKMQSEHIMERIGKFDNKLYLEFGGKLFDDFHASRVLPGFAADSKLQMLMKVADQAEIVMVVSADDIEKNKIRADLGITYDEDVIRLINEFRSRGLYVGSVVLSMFANQHSANKFQTRLAKMGIPVYHHYMIPGYPTNVPFIVSEEGFGKNDFIETTRSLIVVTAPGPGSGKMATCLSQLYHENKRGLCAGYAKYETFPIWNLALKHPVNLAYEAATADLNDVNMIDPFHFNAYNIVATNYNRDVEVFPILEALFNKIYGESPYKSPTDMGVNMVGFCIEDEEKVKEACSAEIIRRYFEAKLNVLTGKGTEKEVEQIKLIMKQIGTTVENRKVVDAAISKEIKEKAPVVAIELEDGVIITGKQTSLLTATSAALLNSIKTLAGIKDKLKLISPTMIEPLQKLKKEVLKKKNARLNAQDLLTILSITAPTNPIIEEALNLLTAL